MNANSLSACVLMLGAAMTVAAPPRVPVMVDPNDPEKTRTIISREEREKLGLTPRTWSGVVHPDVYATLDRLNRTVASLKDRLKRGRDVQAFDALRRIRFEGMVYVQVQVKDRDAQRRVLASLKASEFHVPYLFEKSAGLTGYVTKEGLDKLAKNPEVVGVCLDDKPVPKDPPAAVGEHPRPGEKPKWTIADGKVDPQVREALEKSPDGHVFIIVTLKRDVPRSTAWGEKKAAIRKTQERVLSGVSADEFRIRARSVGGALNGHINAKGLEKLGRHPDVVGIQLTRRYTTHAPERR